MSTLSKSLVAVIATLAAGVLITMQQPPKEEQSFSLPPAHAQWDYQIGGPYRPAADVQIVSRDRTVPPAPGLYNICYVNAFQVQPGEQSDWPADLLLRDANGNLVMDEEWGEALLDLRTDDKRIRVAAKVNGWIDGCASSGYNAVEPDNYDSFSRSKGLLKTEHATAYIRLLADHAHARDLAIAQKNTLELASQRQALGLDFAVVEECGEWDECEEFTSHFGTAIVVVEYSDKGLAAACASVGDQVSVARRDVDVSPVGSPGHARETC